MNNSNYDFLMNAARSQFGADNPAKSEAVKRFYKAITGGFTSAITADGRKALKEYEQKTNEYLSNTESVFKADAMVFNKPAAELPPGKIRVTFEIDNCQCSKADAGEISDIGGEH